MKIAIQSTLAFIAAVGIVSAAIAQAPMTHDRLRLRRELDRVTQCGYGLTPVAESLPSVSGRIDEVRGTFALVSIGSDDGLSVGRELEVYRDRRRVGTIIVRRVDPDRSVVEVGRGFERPLLLSGDLVVSPAKPADAKRDP